MRSCGRLGPATLGPIDAECASYLRATGRPAAHVRRYEDYYRAQGLWGMPQRGDIDYSQELELDIGTVRPSVAGPKRPQDRIELSRLKQEFAATLARPVAESGFGQSAAALAKTVRVSANGTFHGGGGSQEPVSPESAAARDTNLLTEREMTNNRGTPDAVAAPAPRIGAICAMAAWSSRRSPAARTPPTRASCWPPACSRRRPSSAASA